MNPLWDCVEILNRRGDVQESSGELRLGEGAIGLLIIWTQSSFVWEISKSRQNIFQWADDSLRDKGDVHPTIGQNLSEGMDEQADREKREDGQPHRLEESLRRASILSLSPSLSS
jgi:hypothetical protein